MSPSTSVLAWPCVVCGAKPGELCTPGIRRGPMRFGTHGIRYDTRDAANPVAFMRTFTRRDGRMTPAAERALHVGLTEAVEMIRHNAFNDAVRILIVATEAADLADRLEAVR